MRRLPTEIVHITLKHNAKNSINLSGSRLMIHLHTGSHHTIRTLDLSTPNRAECLKTCLIFENLLFLVGKNEIKRNKD